MTHAMLNFARTELRRRYVNHEINADTYASLLEEITLAERRAS